MSWVSFWIEAQAVPARTTIGLLTVMVQYYNTTETVILGFPNLFLIGLADLPN